MISTTPRTPAPLPAATGQAPARDGSAADPPSPSLADIPGMVLRKGLAIDAYPLASSVGIELATAPEPGVVAGADIYLGLAEAASRLSGIIGRHPFRAGRPGQEARNTTPASYAYVYGIVPADVTVGGDACGLGNPPATARLVRYGRIGALVSDVDLAQPLGQPADLLAHQQLLDAAATAGPVLPLRFGAVLPDDDAVTDSLLSPYHDDFAAQLTALEGQRQFVLRGRYDEAAILREVLAERPAATALSRRVAAQPAVLTRQARIWLGEMISAAVDGKRAADTRLLGAVVAPHCMACSARPPEHELDAVYLAMLVSRDGERGLSAALGGLSRRWAGRVELRLLGPMAPYDFVNPGRPHGTPRPGVHRRALPLPLR